MSGKDLSGAQISVEGFLSSLERCTKKKGFFDVFYQHFISSSPEVEKFFSGTDMRSQTKMLEKSLRLAAVAIVGSDIGIEELEKRAASHDAQHLNVDPSLYAFWLEALVQSAADYDPEWDEVVEADWRVVLTFVVDTMIAGYECSLERRLAS